MSKASDAKVLIRHSVSADYVAAQAIYAEASVIAGTLQLPFPPLEKWQHRLSNLPQGYYCLVAEVGGEVVGHLGFETYANPRRKHVGSFGMGVKTAHQGHGVGSALLAAIIDLAENWLNISRIEIAVYPDNAAALALYQKFGFIVEGEAAQHSFRDGQYVSVVQLARLRAQV